jgi:hypothetical protein
MEHRFWNAKKIHDSWVKGSTPLFYHILVILLSAGIALSLPYLANIAAETLLTYWSIFQSEKIFLVSVELALAIFLVLFTNFVTRSVRDHRLAKMARNAGLLLVTPSRGFLAKRRIRNLKRQQGFARDVMIIGSTGFRTMVDPKGCLHQVVGNCREAKIMLLNPEGEGARTRARSIADPEITSGVFAIQVKSSIEFLKGIRAGQRNIRLKLYDDIPFLKLSILGDYVWVQHYHPRLDVQTMPKFVFDHRQNPGSLYVPFREYFFMRWEDPLVPEYDFDTDELVYRDENGMEWKRARFGEFEREPEPLREMAFLSVQEEHGELSDQIPDRQPDLDHAHWSVLLID